LEAIEDMYIGLEIDSEIIHGIKHYEMKHYREIALSNYDRHYKKSQRIIRERFVLKDDGEIEVKSIENMWFPNVKCHVFLSHSHHDEDKALILAGYLKEKCDVDVFVDSCIWKYSNDLLKLLDEHYCKTRFGHYDYSLRNITTTQVHLILNMALAKMINSTECFMFLKTSNSMFRKKDFLVAQTESAWICDELLIASLLARRSKKIHRKEFRMEHSFSINESFQGIPRFIYDISFMDLKKLTYNQLLEIATLSSSEYYGDAILSRAERFLDLLYDKIGVKEIENING